MSAQYKFLVLGPLSKSNGIKGGITISFSIFLEELKKNKIDFEVISTSRSYYKYKVIGLIYTYWLFFKKVRKCSHVSLHGQDKDYIYLAPGVIFVSKLLGKTVSLRKFAGSFIEIFESLSIFKQVLVKYSLSNSDINFFQTKYLVEYFQQYNPNTSWFPTVRSKPKFVNIKGKIYQKRFIFLGHIRPEKGVDEIIEVSNLLDGSYHIDMYGPIIDDKYNKIDWKRYRNITYKGELKPSEVYSVLSEHDILLLPTYWKGEGYPGVVIEAFSLGIPVISTKLKGISEIVNEKSGILIEAKNVEQLKDAMLHFNNENFSNFSKSSLESFKQFDAEIEINNIIEKIKIVMQENT